MPRFKLSLLCAAILTLALCAFAQQQATPPKAQTARQALLEMVTKGGDAITKHLTVEVQNLLTSGRKSSWGFGMIDSMKPEKGIQTFDSGEVLLAYSDAAKNTKYEVHVDSDDLAGDQDSMLLSIHEFRDGTEQNTEWGLLSSHFTVSMKLQQGVWRLDKVTIGAEFPVGDPQFITKTLLNTESKVAGAGLVLPTPHTDLVVHSGSDTADMALPAMAPGQVLQMLAVSESVFARQHPDAGFTCSFSELAETSKMMGIDPQVSTGTYNGYRFALSGCEGKPAGSFQIIAEPVVAVAGAQAFCSDATQNVRVSADGRGATCLSAGKVESTQFGDEAGVTGFRMTSSEAKPKE